MKSDTFNMGIVALDVNADANAAVFYFEDGSAIDLLFVVNKLSWSDITGNAKGGTQ